MVYERGFAGKDITPKSVTADKVDIAPEVGTDTKVRTEPFVRAVTDGYLVGVGQGEYVIEDPTDFGSDDAAMQSVVDELNDQGTAIGILYFGPRRPDGTEWDITSTVNFSDAGNSSEVYPIGIGWGQNTTDGIQSSITDGSPMFQFDGVRKPRALEFGGFVLDGNGQDCEGIRIADGTNYVLSGISFEEFGDGSGTETADGALVLDGGVYNGQIKDFYFTGTQNSLEAIQLVEDKGTGQPGEIWIGPWGHMNSGYSHGLVCGVNSGLIKLGGRWEDAKGDSAIKFTNGALMITSWTQLGNNSDVSDAVVIFTGIDLAIDDCVPITNSGGHGVRTDNSIEEAYIGNMAGTTAGNIDNNTLDIADPGSGSIAHLPNRRTVPGDVSYPNRDTAGVYEERAIFLGREDLTSLSLSGAPSWQERHHDGTGVVPADMSAYWRSNQNNWRLKNPVSFSYTGDGTQGRTLAAKIEFEMVIIEEAGGTVVDAYAAGLSNGALSGGSFSGELTVESPSGGGGITVGDNDADADPNTDGETYHVYAG